MTDRRNRACFAAHMGYYAIKPDVLQGAVAAWHAGKLVETGVGEDTPPLFNPARDVHGGVAVIRMDGPFMRLRSKFGGVSSNEAADVVRTLDKLPGVHTVLLSIDSPGGQVSGGFQLADAIHGLRKHRRVHAHVNNLAASLGYLVASQADSISIDRSAMAGCIGVYALLQDVTGMAEKAGVKVTLVSTGHLKGQGAPGTPVTPELVAEEQKHVDHWGDLFVDAIARGRNIDADKARTWMTGQCWHAKDCVEMGVVDAVCSADDCMADLIAGRPVRTGR
ncbi:MAG: S49 family peptidase [Planctomycetes bacterium]|nr:S49 family peptidase [Planctomycetota bacterium]